ncbi:substrate-binding protein [Natronomonas gomsonensis]|uniref:substrate-binding protein n=1 Tax=Natronomonas gomsonensis TaxID=1046043 RepID=UPI0015C0EFEB|nr:substrate-binding protein [Natronomonas gomsonensis]
MSSKETRLDRRTVLKGAGAAGIAGLAGCLESGNGDGNGNGNGDSEYPSLGNYPIEGDTATLGFNVPQTGPYQEEGADELRAYELAADHLNNGGGWVDLWDDLSGDGVNGYEIDYVTGDTATDADTARESGSRMISRDDVIMFSGGSSSATAIAQQELAQQENVQFMCCLTHSNDTTGKDCVRYSFREMFNAYMTGQALAPIVTEEFGDDLEFYQLYADYTWGQTQQASMRQFFEEAGWTEVDSVPTPLGTDDYSTYLQDARDSGADVLFLNHYGLDGSNSVSQAVDQGIDEDMEIVVPLYNVPMAAGAGGSIEGVFGTDGWDANLDNEATRVFAEAFREEYDKTPSSPARLAYSATMLYAAAVERAGTFYPPEVIRELEGYEWDNGGIGEEVMRECDHQTMRDILVVRGLSAEEQDPDAGRYWEVVEQSSYPDDVGYDCDSGPAAECELPEYGDE